jgi:hypothetical protein
LGRTVMSIVYIYRSKSLYMYTIYSYICIRISNGTKF